MERSTLALLAIALFFTLTSEKCDKAKGDGTTGTSATSAPAMTSIVGTRWKLATLSGEAIKLPEGVENPYLSIAADNQLSGFGGCNKLMGFVKLEGASLSFPGVGSTKMYCKETQPMETSFLTALRATRSYKLEGDKLTLLDTSKELATLVSAK